MVIVTRLLFPLCCLLLVGWYVLHSIQRAKQDEQSCMEQGRNLKWHDHIASLRMLKATVGNQALSTGGRLEKVCQILRAMDAPAPEHPAE